MLLWIREGWVDEKWSGYLLLRALLLLLEKGRIPGVLVWDVQSHRFQKCDV